MEFAVPNPSPLTTKGARRNEGDIERQVFCGHYAQCLDQAVKRGWDAWTCRRCELRTHATPGLRPRDYAEQRPRGWNDL
jgi:hypothetical protein